MNLRHILTSGLLILGFISLSAQTYRVKIREFTVSGTSTLHKWTSKITEVSGHGVFQMEHHRLSAIRSLELSFPVKGIISTKGKIMDTKTWEALKSDQHPNVIYLFEEADAFTKTDEGYRLTAKGHLQIAGVKKPVSMQITGKLDSDGTLHFSGKHTIALPYYKIEPPKALMGTVVVGEDVVVAFDVTFEKN
jgi:polyisoprenoid-binding protein YceI